MRKPRVRPQRGSREVGPPCLTAERLERDELTPRKCASLARRALFRFRLEIAGRVVDVAFDDERARDAFASRFAHHATARQAEFSYCVAHDGRNYYFWSPRSLHWRWPDGIPSPQGVAFLADAAIVSAIVRSDSELMSIHASVVSHRGLVAAIGGPSWAGKTTTAVACARIGMRLYSDERLLLRGRTVYPFQRTCTLRSQGRELLAQESGTSIDDALAGCWTGEPGTLTAIFTLGDRGADAFVRRIAHHQAVPALFPWMDSREGDFKRLAQLVELVASVPCFALHLGTPGASAAVIADTLEHLERHVA